MAFDGVLLHCGEIFLIGGRNLDAIHRYNINGEHIGEFEVPSITLEQPTPRMCAFTASAEIQAEGTGVKKSVEDVIAEIEEALKEQ